MKAKRNTNYSTLPGLPFFDANPTYSQPWNSQSLTKLTTFFIESHPTYKGCNSLPVDNRWREKHGPRFLNLISKTPNKYYLFDGNKEKQQISLYIE